MYTVRIMKIWDFLAQNINQNLYFVTPRQDWLGIANPKNVFRSTFHEVDVKFFLKISNLTEFSTNLLLTDAFRQA